MGELVIRNVESGIVERLQAKAAARCQSLEQMLGEILSEAVSPGREDLLSEADAICRLFAALPPGMPTAAQWIREERDNDEPYR
ncbi:MAG: hypothetical protein H7837_10055 [Magnetococcus sp. MYC-9]